MNRKYYIFIILMFLFTVVLAVLFMPSPSRAQDGQTCIVSAQQNIPAKRFQGYCVPDVFLKAWQGAGLDLGDTGITFRESLLLWGYPLEEARFRVNSSGDRVLTQTFERMVFEHHPNNAGTPYEVLFRRMGAEWLVTPTSVPPTATPTATRMPTATATPTPTPTATAPYIPSDEARCLNATEQEFLRLINDYRKQNNLQPLTNSARLNLSSHHHSMDMATRKYFSHTTISPLPANQPGPSFSDRMTMFGYTYNTVRGENIAAGYSTAQLVFNGWKNSPGHNTNMLAAGFNTVGIGLAVIPGSPYTYYWTTNFGGFSDGAPVGC